MNAGEIGKTIDSAVYVMMAFATPLAFYAYFKMKDSPFYKKKWILFVAPLPVLSAILSIYNQYWGL